MNSRVVPDEPDADFERWLGGSFETWLPSKRAVAFRSLNREHIAYAGDTVYLEHGAFKIARRPT